MGIGVISLVTSQKKEQSGPPFVTGSANNGLSVDTVSGRIVLGNNVGQAGNPAQLVSNREIVTENAALTLFGIILNAIQTGITTTLNGSEIRMVGAAATNPLISILTGAVGIATVRVGSGGDRFTITSDSFGSIVFSAGTVSEIGFMNVNTATISTQIGPTLVTSNTAALQVSGNLTKRDFIVGIGAGATVVDRDLDSDKLFFNSAAASLTLPNMAAANFRAGFRLRANCANVAGITITASAGQVIRFGSLVTSSGGTISSTDVGAFISIIIINSGTWVTESFNGAWVLT